MSGLGSNLWHVDVMECIMGGLLRLKEKKHILS